MIKGLIWHYSLTSIYTECPYCKAVNSEDARRGICKCCGEVVDLVNVIEKKSKDVLECEAQGLQGPVHKNDKGKWEEWQDPYKTRRAM